MILWLSGPTGAGKSTVAKILEDRGWTVIREAIEADLFARFSVDPKVHCARLQASIMQSRQQQWASVGRADKVVFDRSADEDFHVFCRMHAASGLLTEDDLSRLLAISIEVSANTPTPDLILYLRPHSEILAARVASGHPPAITKNLPLQISLYDEWVEGRTGSVLRLDNSRSTYGATSTFLREL